MFSYELLDGGGRPDEGRVVADLVHGATEGDQAAWDALVDRFSGLVWAIARAHRLNSADAAEVTQSVWLKLVENLGRVREPRRLGAWLASVTRHECLRRIRQASKVVVVADVADDRRARLGDEIDAGLLADERSVALLRAFDRLPAEWRSLMRLLTVEPRLSYAEIADALGIPIGSIGPIRQRCLCRLRNSPEIVAMAGVAS